jgi:cyclic pyranopterin phosphate synthase
MSDDGREHETDEPTHLDASGRTRMVDVTGKPVTARRAVAAAELVAGEAIMSRVSGGRVPKGNIYETARLAGIQAAKRTWELVPLCHSLSLDHVDVTFEPTHDRIRIRAEAATRAATGVEMEALTAACVAGLTLYDMLKSMGKSMRLESVRLVEKSGGRSGTFRDPEASGRDENAP